jgi:3-phosphoshikimate 1-carboxyvinyltransferase
MVAPCGTAPIDIVLTGTDIGARGYIDLTVACMRAFGATVTEEGESKWRVEPGGYHAVDYLIEPDASAATYLWAAEVLTGGSIDIGDEGLKFSQPDALAREVIRQFPNMPAEIDGSQMQDAVPTLAVLAAFNNQPVRFVNIENLRVKECDRTQALADGLNAIRAGLAEMHGDDLLVQADPALRGGHYPCLIDTHADHRHVFRSGQPGDLRRTHPGPRMRWQDLPTLLGRARLTGCCQ